MKKIVVATNNEGKLKEIKDILKDYELLTLKDINCEIEVDEDQETFEGNAKKKAKEFKYVTRKTDFGYTAVHFGVDLPGGIKGEIQVMSPKIAAFKDIEDICYKGLSGKGLPTGYGRLKPAFDKIDPEVDKEAYDEFAAYTRHAYAHERKKRSKDKESAFLSIPDGSRIPPRLDFNNIAKMRDSIENARREKEAQRMREEAAKLIDNIMAD